MNNIELQGKVRSAMYTLIKENGIATTVEVLIRVGVLSKEDCEKWRFGKIPYLEKVCKVNLGKLSTIHREIRAYAKKNNLKPSWTYYKRWGLNGKIIQLRFSKSGDEQIERLYATHYISQQKVKQTKESREILESDKAES